MRIVKGKLKYDLDEERFYIEDLNGITSPYFHCGDVFSIRIDETWHKTRIEYNGEWFLVLRTAKEIKIYGNQNIEGIEAMTEW